MASLFSYFRNVHGSRITTASSFEVFNRASLLTQSKSSPSLLHTDLPSLGWPEIVCVLEDLKLGKAATHWDLPFFRSPHAAIGPIESCGVEFGTCLQRVSLGASGGIWSVLLIGT